MIWRTLFPRGEDALDGSPGGVVGRFTCCLGAGGIHINSIAVCVVGRGGARARRRKVLCGRRQHRFTFDSRLREISV